MTEYTTIHAAATAALEHFHTKKRDSGTSYIATDKLGGPPTWVQDMCHEAHGGMLPDDYKYRMIRDTLQHIVEEDEGEPEDTFRDLAYEWADSDTEIYNAALTEWLGSNLGRSGYVDEEMEEAGAVWPEGGVFALLQAGYGAECREVYGLVIDYLDGILDEEVDESAAA